MDKKILAESTESLESFVLSVLEDNEEDPTIYGYIARWTEQEPFWSLFMVSMDNDTMYCGGHYPLNNLEIEDIIKVLSLFAELGRKIIVNTDGYFAW